MGRRPEDRDIERIPDEDELALDVPVAARMLGISRASGYRHLPTIKIGSRRKVLRSWIEKILADQGERDGPP